MVNNELKLQNIGKSLKKLKSSRKRRIENITYLRTNIDEITPMETQHQVQSLSKERTEDTFTKRMLSYERQLELNLKHITSKKDRNDNRTLQTYSRTNEDYDDNQEQVKTSRRELGTSSVPKFGKRAHHKSLNYYNPVTQQTDSNFKNMRKINIGLSDKKERRSPHELNGNLHQLQTMNQRHKRDMIINNGHQNSTKLSIINDKTGVEKGR